ncbi:MAG: DNA recombination protein RmuC [Opitutus sp.]
MTLSVYLFLGIAIGLIVGWLLRAARKTAPDSRIEDELRKQAVALKTELEKNTSERMQAEGARAAAEASRHAAEQQRLSATEQLSVLTSEAKASQERLAATTTALATAEANLRAAEERYAEQKRTHDDQHRVLKEAHEKALSDLREAFKALSADALKQSQPEFLRLANETMAKFNESAKGDLAQRQEAIATLVKPLEEQLKIYQQRLAQSETTQASTLGEVTKHLSALAQQSLTLSTETLQLRRVLSSGQARGKWGEETLRRVVEAAGMSAHCDFTEQAQSEDKKPDLIVRLPGDRFIIVDAKVPDLDFLNALGTADEVKRAESLKAHADKMRATIKALADRDYPSQFPNSLDHVVLFLPAESLFSAALEGDSEMIVWAAQRRILLTTPASLIALLRSVSVSWQQHEQTVNAKEIAEAAAELFSRVATFAKHFVSIGAGLARANAAYNEAVGSYERSVRPSGDRMVKLGTDAGGKTLPEPDLLTEQLRPAPAALGVESVMIRDD